MSDEVLTRGRRPRRTPIILMAAMLALLAMLAWQRRGLIREVERKTEKNFGRVVGATPSDSPLETADFLGEEPFELTGDFAKLSAPQYRTALAASGKVRDLKQAKQASLRWTPYTVPESPDSPTKHAHLDRYYAYRLRELSAYERLTRDAGGAREAGTAFLQAYLAFSCQRPDALSLSEVEELGAAALAAGSRDPMVRTYAAYIHYSTTGDASGAEAVWAETVQELPTTQYPRIVQVFARYFIDEVGRKEGRPNASQNRLGPLAVSVVRWLEEESLQPEWIDCVFARLLRIWDEEYHRPRESILIGCLHSARIDPAVLHFLLGDHHISAAWRHRGSGFAHEVKPEAWAPFNDHMRKASAHLQYAWMLRPDLPHAPQKMILVAKAGFDDGYQPYDWFLRSCDARLDHWPSYSQMLDALRPRWGGSLREMLNFSEKCLESNRFDTFLPYAFLDFLDDIRNRELEGDRERLKALGVHPLFEQFLRRRSQYRESRPNVELYGDSWYYRTRLGLLLEEFDLPAAAAAEFQAANGRFDRTILQADNRPGMHLLRRLHAAQGDVRQRVIALDETLRSRTTHPMSAQTFAELEAELSALEPTAPDMWAVEYYQHARRMLEQRRAYFEGNWVHLDFANGGLGWEICADEFDASKPEDILIVNRRLGMMSQVWARPLVPFEPPFEMEAVIEHVRGKQRLGTIGLQWTRVEPLTLNDWLATEPFVGTDPTFACFSSAITRLMDRNWARNDAGGPQRIRWKLWPRNLEGTIDGNWRTVLLAEPIRPDGVLGIGEPYKSFANLKQNGGEVRISGVRVRRLEIAPPPGDETSPEARAEYWASRVSHDSRDLIALARLAEVKLQQRQFGEVLDLTARTFEAEPRFDRVHGLRARALMLTGRYREAHQELELALAEPFDDMLTYMTSAELLAAAPVEDLRNGKFAVGRATMALRHGGADSADVIAAFAAAHAEAGDYNEARTQNRRAIDMAPEGRLKQELQSRQELYEADRPYRMPVVDTDD